MAVPLAGEIHFSGNWTPIDSEGNPLAPEASLALAAGVQFLPLVESTDVLFPIVQASGIFSDLAPYVSGGNLQYHNVSIVTESFLFSFDAPIVLWSAGAISFVMTSAAAEIVKDETDAKVLKFEATGTIAMESHEADGRYLFAGGAYSQFAFWSMAEVAQPVPEPGTLSLIGATLLGLGVLRRRRSR